jgi:hypothetical protein
MAQYTNPRAPASFSGLAKFHQNHKNIKPESVKLLDTYIFTKQVPDRFPRRQTIVGHVNSQWQADLIDIKNMKHDSFILTVIDVFSRYAMVRFINSKSMETVQNAFTSIFNETKCKPEILYTDAGNEFSGSRFQDKKKKTQLENFYKANNIVQIKKPLSIHKASLVERFNRTLRQKVHRYLVYKNSGTKIDKLQDLVYSYNNTIHPAHGFTPEYVFNSSTEKQKEIAAKMYNGPEFESISKEEDLTKNDIKFEFKVGDYVRAVNSKSLFEKSTNFKRWSNQVYQITKLWPSKPPTYEIDSVSPILKVEDKNRSGENFRLARKHYKWELQKVGAPKNETKQKTNSPKEKNQEQTSGRQTRSQTKNLKNSVQETSVQYPTS